MDPKNTLQEGQMDKSSEPALEQAWHSVGKQGLIVSRYQLTSVPKWLLGVV